MAHSPELAMSISAEAEKQTSEDVLQRKLAESPFAEINTLLPEQYQNLFTGLFLDQILSVRKAYFTAYHTYWATRDAKKLEETRQARDEYLKVPLKIKEHLKKLDADFQDKFVGLFMQAERTRLNDIKASQLGTKKEELWKRTKESVGLLVPDKVRSILFALFTLGTVSAVELNQPQPQFETYDASPDRSATPEQQWSTEGLMTDDDFRSEEQMMTLAPEFVERGEGAEHAFQRLLPRLGEEGVARLFAQLDTPLPASVEAQAHILALALNLENPQGQSALVPYIDEQNKSSFVATVVRGNGRTNVEIVFNRPHQEPTVLLDTAIGPIPYEGPFVTH